MCIPVYFMCYVSNAFSKPLRLLLDLYNGQAYIKMFFRVTC